MALVEKVPAIALGVVAVIGDGEADDAVGGGVDQLVAVGVGAGGVVDEFVFVEIAVGTVFELFVEEGVFVAGELEDGAASEGAVGGEQFDEIIVAADGAAGIGDHDIKEQLALPGGLTFGAVEVSGFVDAAEEGVGGEGEVVADPGELIAPALTAFEMDAGAVVDVAFAVDDGAADEVVAHGIVVEVHPIAVGIGGDDAKGIVIDLNNVPSQYRNKFVNQGLIGFRVEYLNSDGTKIPNFFRIITSSFYCEPVIQNLTNTSQKAIRYRYVESTSNLLFCTLSPSSSPTNKPSATPFIGQPDQNIIITNTFFNPITTEVEIVEHDISTLAIALYGNQTKSIDDGIYTIYDSANNIYKQYNLFEVRDQFNELLYEVRQDRNNNIDFSKSFNNIV